MKITTRYGTEFEDTYPTAPAPLHSKHDGPDPKEERKAMRIGFIATMTAAGLTCWGLYQLIKFVVGML